MNKQDLARTLHESRDHGKHGGDGGCKARNGIPEEDEIPMWETPIYAAMMFEQVPQRILLGLDPSAEAQWRDSIPGRLWAVEGDPEMGVLFKKTNLTPYINAKGGSA